MLQDSPLGSLSERELERVLTLEHLYELLGVGPMASRDEIKRAYRVKAKQFHPDMNRGATNTLETMIRLNEARDVLSSDTLRVAYDWLRFGGAGRKANAAATF